MAEHDPVSEATQNKQTTRFQYPRGDAVIAKFFASNVYKSAALIDVVYLFHLDYGADADVSQILRERLMDSARSNGAATPTPPATKRSVAMPDVTDVTDVTDNTDNTESVDGDDKSDKQPAQEPVEKTAAPDESEKSEKQGTGTAKDTDTAAVKDTVKKTAEKSNTDTKSSEFNIAEMFD